MNFIPSRQAPSNSETIVNDNNSTVNPGYYLIHKTFFNKPKNKNHRLTDWEPISADLSKVTLELCNGRTLIPSYIDYEELTNLQKYYEPKTLAIAGKQVSKDWSVDHSHILSSDILIIDYDAVSINELKDTRFIDWAFLGYPTPSAILDPIRGWTKHRWLIKLPQKVNEDRLSFLRKAFLEKYCSDSDFTVTSTQQIIYGRKLEENEILKRDLECVLPVDIYLELRGIADTKAERQKGIKKERSDNSVVTKIDDHLFGYISENSLSSFVETTFPDFSWNLKEVSNDHDTIQKVVGSNPFSVTNSSGSSLCWMLKDDGRIMILDRANNYSCNFPEFHARYQYFQDRGIILDRHDLEDKVTLDLETKGIKFIEAIKSIDKKLNLTPFKFDDNKPSAEDIEQLGEFVKVSFDATRDTTYHYYHFEKKIWHTSLNITAVITGTVVPYLRQIGSDNITVVRKHSNGKPILDENGNEQKDAKTLTDAELGISANKILTELIVSGKAEIQKPLSRNNNYIGFKNGDFNLSSKQLESFDSKNMLFARFERDFEERSAETIEKFRIVLNHWFGHSGLSDTYLSYLAAILMNKGSDIQDIVFFIGEAGSGKSMVAAIAQRIYQFNDAASCLLLTGNGLDHKFGLGKLTQATQVIIVQEVKSLWGDLIEARLKSGWGNAEGKIEVESKGKAMTTVHRNFGLICDRQDYPFQDSNDNGYLRRVLYFTNSWVKLNDSSSEGCIDTEFYENHFKPTIENADECWNLFLSILTNVSCDEAVRNFNISKKDEIFKKSRDHVAEANDPFIDLINEQVEIIEGDEETIRDSYVLKQATMEAIKMHFALMPQFFPKGTMEVIMKNFRKSLFKIHPELKQYQPPNNRKKINGANHTVIVGIKFKSTLPKF